MNIPEDHINDSHPSHESEDVPGISEDTETLTELKSCQVSVVSEN